MYSKSCCNPFAKLDGLADPELYSTTLGDLHSYFDIYLRLFAHMLLVPAAKIPIDDIKHKLAQVVMFIGDPTNSTHRNTW